MKEASASQTENHVDGGFHFYRIVVQKIGSVAPRLHCIQRSLLQHRRSGDNSQILDRARFRDGGLQNDRTLAREPPSQSEDKLAASSG